MLTRISRLGAVSCGAVVVLAGCKNTPPVQQQLRIERVRQPAAGYKVGDPTITYEYVAHNGSSPLRWEFRDDWSTWALKSEGENASLSGEPLVGFAHEPPTMKVVVTDADGQTASIDEKVSPANHPRVRTRITARRWQGTYWLFEVTLNSAFTADSQRIKRQVLQAFVDTEGLIEGDRIQVLDGVNDTHPSDWHSVVPHGSSTYTKFGTQDEGEWFSHSSSGASNIISTTVAGRILWVKIALKDGKEREILDPKIECVVY